VSAATNGLCRVGEDSWDRLNQAAQEWVGSCKMGATVGAATAVLAAATVGGIAHAVGTVAVPAGGGCPEHDYCRAAPHCWELVPQSTEVAAREAVDFPGHGNTGAALQRLHRAVMVHQEQERRHTCHQGGCRLLVRLSLGLKPEKVQQLPSARNKEGSCSGVAADGRILPVAHGTTAALAAASRLLLGQ